MEIKIRKNILEKNLTEADRNRQFFLGKKVFVLNMMSSPGSGKTQTLCRTLAQLMPDIQVGVVVGISVPPTMRTAWPKPVPG